jgi:pimeloyl-ACP methyl ester carboxylesterase
LVPIRTFLNVSFFDTIFIFSIAVISKRDWHGTAMQHNLREAPRVFTGHLNKPVVMTVYEFRKGSEMNIVFIHGHRATARSFNFLAKQLQGHRQIFLEYNSENGFETNHRDMLRRLKGVRDIFFVAHSLGGIHALHLADKLQSRVLGAVTISTPYGGSEVAEVLAYMMPFNRVLQDIRPRSAPIIKSKEVALPRVWTNIVSVKGHMPWMAAANDGVVTLASMRQRNDIRLVEVDSNHYEVLLDESTVAAIRNSIREIEHSRKSVCRIFSVAQTCDLQ